MTYSCSYDKMLPSKHFPILSVCAADLGRTVQYKDLRFDFGPRLGEIQGFVYDIVLFIELPHDSFSNM